MRSKKQYVIIVIAIAVIVAGIYIISDRNLGMVIPPDDVFINAPSSEACKEFDISFTYDDSMPPVESHGEKLQEIRWSLLVYPKEGVEAKDFYCTLILDDWVVSRSSSPSTKYMGLSKGMRGDMPSEYKGAGSSFEKFVHFETTKAPEYKESMEASVRIMLSYNGNKEYYFVTPKFKVFDGGSETFQAN